MNIQEGCFYTVKLSTYSNRFYYFVAKIIDDKTISAVYYSSSNANSSTPVFGKVTNPQFWEENPVLISEYEFYENFKEDKMDLRYWMDKTRKAPVRIQLLF